MVGMQKSRRGVKRKKKEKKRKRGVFYVDLESGERRVVV